MVDVDDVLLGVDIGTGSSKAVLVRRTAGSGHRHAPARGLDAAAGLGRAGRRALVGRRRRRSAASCCRRRPAHGSPASASAASGRACCWRRRPAARCAPRSCTASTPAPRPRSRELTQALRRRRDPQPLRHGAARPRRSARSCSGSRRHEPEVWARARLLVQRQLVRRCQRLTGEYVLDHHSASQCDPLYDIARRGLGRRLGAARSSATCELPRLVWPAEVVGDGHRRGRGADRPPRGHAGVRRARSTPGPRRSASASAQPGDLMLMYGSTMFFVQVLERAVVAPELWTTAGRRPGLAARSRRAWPPRAASPAGCRSSPAASPFEQLVAEAAATAARRRRPAGAAVLRRRAHPDLRPARPRRDRRADA